MSAMLQTCRRPVVYDGFRDGTLNVPLARWEDSPALYHLHGSVAWIRDDDGTLRKPSLDYVRAVEAVQHWADGTATEGWPSVVLGDLKSRQSSRFPFTLFYGELRAQLAKAKLVVVGGYSFGDRPVNRELAHYLAKSKDQRLLVWTRRPHLRQILARLQVQLDAERTVLAADQIETEAIVLPDSAAVDRVIERFRPA